MSYSRRVWIGAWLLLVGGSLFGANIKGRYIVELTSDSVAEHVGRLPGRNRLQSREASAQRVKVRGEQRQLRSRLEQRKTRVLDNMETVGNALFVEMNEDQVAAVAATAGVKSVRPVRMFRLYLDRAVELHKVREVWNQLGEDRAGVGIKVGIIDTGIESSHPGFQDSSMTVPDGYPKTNQSSDIANTNSKVIVARSYVNLLPTRDPDGSARDRVGHGTALAMIVAGTRTTAPLASMSGIAPKAWLGNYKVFGSPGFNDGAAEDAILKAIDDAVADGMDVINLSLGTDFAPRLIEDPTVQAVERATKAGVIVVVAAGNNGPELNTLGSPATAPSSIAVGATTNDRIFASSVEAEGIGQFVAIASDQSSRTAALNGTVTDVEALDGTGLACNTLPAGSLSGRVALILRGTCTFEVKLNNAQRAGATAALVYAAADSPSPIAMAAGTATLPAEMISYASGVALKQGVAAQNAPQVTLRFTLGPVSTLANRLTDFTAAGPSVDSMLKPDLMAVGHSVYTATQTLDARGDMYSSNGFIAVNGTSFSTPVVAGVAALVKSARPGLTVAQYRSLLINSASLMDIGASLQQTGAGLLDASAAVRSTVAAYPTSLSLGSGNADPQVLQSMTLTNVGSGNDQLLIEAVALTGAITPLLERNTVEVAAGASVDIPVLFQSSGLSAGAYEGYLKVTSANTGGQIRVPYWYAVRSEKPAHITVIDKITSARRGSAQTDAVLFRVTDAAGVALLNLQPEVTVLAGDGTVRGVVSHDDEIPGLYGLTLRLGPLAGNNTIRIQAGDVVKEITISGL